MRRLCYVKEITFWSRVDCSLWHELRHLQGLSFGKMYGCRIRNKKCAFVKKRCEDNLKLLKGEVDYCFECQCFPCEALRKLDDRYQERYGMSMIDNLRLVKEKGIHQFILIQNHRYSCPECGHMISVHDQKYLYCDRKYEMKC